MIETLGDVCYRYRLQVVTPFIDILVVPRACHQRQ